jgi:hypothetical protein
VTNPYNDNIVIKLIPVESTTTGRTESDIQELIARIQVEDLSPPPFNIRPDGLEVEVATVLPPNVCGLTLGSIEKVASSTLMLIHFEPTTRRSTPQHVT